MDRPIGLISRPFWRSPAAARAEWNLSMVGAMLVALILLTLIGWLYLDQAALIRETEMDILRLEEQRAHLFREHRMLQGRLAAAQSVEQVWGQAGALNLRAPGHIETLVVPLVDRPAEWSAERLPAGAAPASGAVENAAPSWLMSVALWLETITFPALAGN
jgi:hypothetical protein